MGRERWQQNHRCMVGHCDAKSFPALRRIKIFSSHHGLKPRHERLQLSQHPFSADRALAGAPATHEEGVAEHLPSELPQLTRSFNSKGTLQVMICSGEVRILPARVDVNEEVFRVVDGFVGWVDDTLR
jgi:hypothetical protein